MSSTFALLLMMQLGCVGSGQQYADCFKARRDHHYRLVGTPAGANWEGTIMLPVHRQIWPEIYKTCVGEAHAAGVTGFEAIAVIDKDGVVTEFFTMPNDPALGCFSKMMVGKKLPPPPVAPFYEAYKYTVRMPKGDK